MGIMKSLIQNKFIKTIMCSLVVSSGIMAGMGQTNAAAPTYAADISGATNDGSKWIADSAGTEVKVTEATSGGNYTGGDIYGAYGSNVTDGTVLVEGGTVRDSICGGYATSGSSNNNTVTISGGTVAIIVGGTGYTNTDNNTVNLIGNNGELNGVINTGIISIGRVMVGSNGGTGNTLNVAGTGTTVKSIFDNFLQNMNFYIGKDVPADSTMLKLNDDISLKNITIRAGVQKGSKLQIDDSVTLIETSKELYDVDTTKIGKLEANDYQDYDLTYELAEENKKLNAIIASAPKNNDNSKSPVETQAAGLTLLTAGADMLAGKAFDNAENAIAKEISEGASPNVLTPFVAMGGAKTKVKSGSHVDVKGWNLNVGFAKEIKNNAGKLLIGPVIEYGKGSYDSYLDNGYHGDGNTSYIGGGVMAKQTNEDGFYYEGSLRAGKMKSDYRANDNSYDSDSTYYTAHLGAGKILKLSDKNSLDYYGKYFYTHQMGDNTTLHVGGVDHPLHFDSVDSHRTRLGGRFIHAMTEKDSVYVGLAWQHEFSGTARATIDGAGTPAPSVKGDTGIMELGWKMNSNKCMDLDLGATGRIGKQQGVGMNLSINFKF